MRIRGVRKEIFDLASEERCAACKARPASRTFVAAPAGEQDLRVARVCDDCHLALVNAFLRDVGGEHADPLPEREGGSIA
jgi:hypothetical protein